MVLGGMAAPLHRNRRAVAPMAQFFGGMLIFIRSSVSHHRIRLTRINPKVRLTVQADAILTSLIYDHALRIRMKAEVSDSAVGAGVGVGTGAANIGVEGPSRDADAARLAQAQSALPAESQSSKDGDNHSGSNIVGRLNNLVTTDIQTITRGRDWLLPGAVHRYFDISAFTLADVVPVLYIPLQVILSITFLYYILGWSAFVALAVLLALFPVPGFIASKLSSTQTGKMKAVSGVCCVL